MTDNERFSHLRRLLLPSYIELEKVLSADDLVTINYYSFETERERFLFIFKRRQRNKELNANVASALKNIIEAFELTTEEKICTTSITKGDLYILAYTNVNMTQLFGILFFQ